MPDWIRRTALADILGTDFAALSDEALYRNLDRLHPQRAAIEQALAERERTLFNLDDTIYLYDLTSTYFEGQCPPTPRPSAGIRATSGRTASRWWWAGPGSGRLPQGPRGLRRQSPGPDHGGRHADALEQRTGPPRRRDRGRRSRDGLRGESGPDPSARPSLSGGRPPGGARAPTWTSSKTTRAGRRCSARPRRAIPGRRRSRVVIKRQTVGDEVHILCRSDGAHRRRIGRSGKSTSSGSWPTSASSRRGSHRGACATPAKIHEAIGRLKERYPRVARYYAIAYDAATPAVTWTEHADKKAKAERARRQLPAQDRSPGSQPTRRSGASTSCSPASRPRSAT